MLRQPCPQIATPKERPAGSPGIFGVPVGEDKKRITRIQEQKHIFERRDSFFTMEEDCGTMFVEQYDINSCRIKMLSAIRLDVVHT